MQLNALSNTELRVATRLLNTLRQDHGIQFKYRDPELSKKLFQTIERLNDPILSALWEALPDQFRDFAQGVKSPQQTPQATQIYRGQVTTQPQASSGAPAVNGDTPPAKTGGKYITYRGKKQWVPD